MSEMRDVMLAIGAVLLIVTFACLVAVVISLIKHKPTKPKVIALCVSFVLMFACAVATPKDEKPEATTEAMERTVISEENSEESYKETDTATEQATTTEKETTTASEEKKTTEEVSFVFDVASIPTYSDEPYTALNDNQPLFSDEEKAKTDEFEYYNAQDHFGRCGVAYANVCKEIMPTEERGEIGHIKPSGWHIDKYNGLIDGNYLYNRCHLIAYSLAGENDNELNLITGTRYMNTEGMNPFELQVLDYVRSTDNHVLYRVTPIFEGDNLLASGVEMEAWSVEDEGEGICFHVYCYNVQPGIVIDYATGDNHLSDEALVTSEETTTETITELTTEIIDRNITESTEETTEYKYILNTSSMKIHLPDCSSVADMAEHNKRGSNDTIEELKENGYKPCQRCLKGR